MLKKPYDFFHKNGINNYYVLSTNEEVYLAVESLSFYRGFFKTKEFTQGLKLLPISSPILKLFLDFLDVKYLGETEIEVGLEPEQIYDTVNVKKTRKFLAELEKEAETKSRFSFTKSTTNPSILNMIEEGSHLLCVENLTTMSRFIWLAKSDKFGTLVIHKVHEMGKPSKPKVSFIDTFVLDKEIIDKFLSKIF